MSRTLYKSQSSKYGELQICINLRAVDHRIIGPHAEPVVVGQRGALLEGVQEDDEDNDGQADGLEVLLIHLQPDLWRYNTKHKSYSYQMVTGLSY